MSWFDKLFGEDNDSTEDYLSKRNQRRQKATQQEKIHYFLRTMMFMKDPKEIQVSNAYFRRSE
ncbi:hypothetical protein GS506_26455 [Rhodococcus hoagii]|nr:hypothetical protein [Prescottella equi]